jgi:hypothetical protein
MGRQPVRAFMSSKKVAEPTPANSSLAWSGGSAVVGIPAASEELVEADRL